MATTSRAADGLGGFTRHRPEDTLLYRVVRTHLAGFLAHARERSEGRGLPRYVEASFRAYLACGVLAHGFTRMRCAGCGLDALVAFSCKGRGPCPSCGARRMSGTAAQLATRVLPDVPLRQWVLAVPFALRPLLAARPAAVTRVLRCFVGELQRWYRDAAGALEIVAASRAQIGAVTFVQRFGGALNLHVHFHVVALDGVYTRAADGAVVFHRVEAPTASALAWGLGGFRPPSRGRSPRPQARRVRDRVRRALRRAGLLGAGGGTEDDGAVVPDALTACAQVATQAGRFATIDEYGRAVTIDADAARFGRHASGACVGEADGFNVHAGVTVAAGDVWGLGLRPRLGGRKPPNPRASGSAATARVRR